MTANAFANIDPRGLREYIEALGPRGCHSVVVLRHGAPVVEAWWAPYRREYEHIMYSVTKSFVSVAVGFAVREGLLRTADRVVDIFADRYPFPPCESMQRVTVKHLLTMTMGHKGRTDNDFYHEEDWLEESLRLYLETEPGTNFFYDNRCANLLAAILFAKTGRTLSQFLTPRLFAPLGMRCARWETTPSGWDVGGWGLSLTTTDLARFGQFLLNGGVWEGKPLLDPAWIAEATENYIDTRGKSVLATEDCWRGYGYLFWHSPFPGAYRGDGALGQSVIVMPEQDMVVAMTAGTNTRGDLLQSTWDLLCPAIDRPCSEADAAKERERLKTLLPTLSRPLPAGNSTPPAAASAHSGKTYRLAENSIGLTALSVEFGPESDKFSFELHGKRHTITAGHGAWIESRLEGLPEAGDIVRVVYPDVAAAAAWDGDEYVVTLLYTRTPYSDAVRLTFEGGGIAGRYEARPVFPLRGRDISLMGI